MNNFKYKFFLSKTPFFLVFLLSIYADTAHAQSITLVSPNGGEKLFSNTTKDIIWKSSDVQSVKIEYSSDNGINWNIISSSFPAFLGNYSWVIPAIASNKVSIKISDAGNSSILDLSDHTFEISSAPFQNQDSLFNNNTLNMNNLTGTLTLTYPVPATNGGIVLDADAGTPVDITWSSSGITQINIDYSINGGTNWNSIASNVTASSGSYSWSIPGSIKPSTQFIIKITEVGGATTDQNANYVFMKNPQTFGGSTIKILPFGDSITHGRKSSNPPDIVAGDDAGYEFKLWDLLRQDDYDFDFIGNKYSGYNYFPDYQNAGFPGYTTQGALDILTDGQHTDFLNNDVFAPDDYLDSFPSDVVMILIGINDDLSTPAARSAAASNVQLILENIHSKDQDTWIILAKLLKTSDATLNTDVQAFNTAIENIANTKIADGYNILIVDMYNIPGFVYSSVPGGDLNDDTGADIHPNSVGYTKMADVWYDALKLILPAGSAAAPAFSQPTVDISANVGIPLNYQAVASGVGTPQYSLTGSPPSGMTINQYTGKISWTPSSTGNFSATIQATNSSGSLSQTLNIQVYEASNKPASLISYVKFNNSSGTDKFIDEVNTNNAVIEGTLTMDDGKIEKAASFNGSFSNKAYFLQEASLNFRTPDEPKFTVEAWIKPSSTSGDQVVIGQYSSRGESHWWLGLTGDKPTFQFHKKDDAFTTYSSVTSLSSVSTTGWTHIVGVKDADLDIYVNGVLTDGPDVTGDVKALRPIDIGSYQNTKYYHGLIDEIAIYKGALDGATIQDHYEDGIYSVQSNVTAFLQGPYNGTDMSTNLVNLTGFPDNQPYNMSPWNYAGLESNSSPPANVVDWVLLELRTGTESSTVISKRAGFLLNGGSIVGLSGSGAVNLYGVLPGKYYITVRHRNHLAVMSKDPVTLNSSSAVSFSFNNQSQVHGTNPMVDLGSGNWGMWAGDANGDGTIKYNGSGNDRFLILIKLGNIQTATLDGYYVEDINLNGEVKYNGLGNDRFIMLNSLDGIQTSSRSTSVPN